MGGHEERLGVASLTSRVMDLARTSHRGAAARTRRQALGPRIETDELGFSVMALSDMY